MAESIPTTMKALVWAKKGEPLSLRTVPTPQPTAGTVLVKVLSSHCNRIVPHVISGAAPFEVPHPFTPGGAAVGRIAAVGPDTTSLVPGQLVLLDPYIRARDNPDVQILWGIYGGATPVSQKLMKDNWASATYAEYTLAPLENTWALDEKTLCGPVSEGGLGYALGELQSLATQAIPYGGFRGIDLKAGETVIIAPATGLVSGAAVGVAVAMGAKVIAGGRNIQVLRKLQTTFPQIKIVQFQGDVQADVAALKQNGPIDAFIDISPVEASTSTHVRSCIMALKQYGRVSLMGVIKADVAIPYAYAVWNSITLAGQYMYEREDVRRLIRMAEAGVLKLGKAGGWTIVGEYKLEDISKGFEVAAQHKAAGDLVLVTP